MAFPKSNPTPVSVDYTYSFSPYTHSEGDEPLDVLPDEILSLIFFFVGPKEAASNLTLVSKRFKALADDPGLWRTFCQRLGLPSKLLEREGLDCKAAYPQMIKLSANLLHNQFVIEYWQETARVPYASSHDLCCYQEGASLYFHNIWSKQLEFSLNPEPAVAQNLTTVADLANQALSLL